MAIRPYNDNLSIDVILCALELTGLVGILDRGIAKAGYLTFTDDENAAKLLHWAAFIFRSSACLQELLGVHRLRAMHPDNGFLLSHSTWLSADENFRTQIDRELIPENHDPGSTNEQVRAFDYHSQLYERRMEIYAHLVLSSAAAVTAGAFNVLVAQEGHQEAASAAFDVMEVVERMLVVNGFTAEDAAILSLERSGETHPASQDPRV
jgi:hypothetical protein